MASTRLSKGKVNAEEYKVKPKESKSDGYANMVMNESKVEETNIQEKIEEPRAEEPKETKVEETPQTKTKKKVGRPKVKTEEETLINIAVPLSVFEQMNVAKSCYSGNLTKYVNAVIIKDLQANYSKYLTINNELNQF